MVNLVAIKIKKQKKMHFDFEIFFKNQDQTVRKSITCLVEHLSQLVITSNQENVSNLNGKKSL